MNTRYLIKNKSNNTTITMENKLWSTVSMEGLDSSFMDTDVIKNISRWNRSLTDLKVDTRDVSVTISPKTGKIEDALEYIEHNLTPGTPVDICCLADVDVRRYELNDQGKEVAVYSTVTYLLRMPAVASNSDYSRWENGMKIKMNFKATEPFFSTEPDRVVTTTPKLQLSKYTSVPTPWDSRLEIGPVSASTKNVIINLDYTSPDSHRNDRNWNIVLNTEKMSWTATNVTLELNSDELVHSKLDGKDISSMIDWGKSVIPVDMSAYKYPGNGELLTISVTDGTFTDIIVSADTMEYQRFISVPTDGSSIINSKPYTSDLIPENIRNGICIGGVWGRLSGEGELCYVNYDGPTAVSPSRQDVVLKTDKHSMNTNITVRKVTSAIDSNIKPENIKNDVEILGVKGSLTGGLPAYDGPFTVKPSTQPQRLDTLNHSMSDNIIIEAVTSAIDSNITEENIKEGVTILGVPGKYKGAPAVEQAPCIETLDVFTCIGLNHPNPSRRVKFLGSGKGTVIHDWTKYSATATGTGARPSNLDIEAPMGSRVELGLIVFQNGSTGGASRFQSILKFNGYNNPGESSSKPATFILKFGFSDYITEVKAMGLNLNPNIDTIMGANGDQTAEFTNCKFEPYNNGTRLPQLMLRLTKTLTETPYGIYVGDLSYKQNLWAGQTRGNVFSCLCANFQNPGFEWVLYLLQGDVSTPLFPKWSSNQKLEFKNLMRSRYNCIIETNGNL